MKIPEMKKITIKQFPTVQEISEIIVSSPPRGATIGDFYNFCSGRTIEDMEAIEGHINFFWDELDALEKRGIYYRLNMKYTKDIKEWVEDTKVKLHKYYYE